MSNTETPVSNPGPVQTQGQRGGPPWQAFIPGLLVITLGAMFLFHSLGLVAVPWRYLRLWPWALIVWVGLMKMSRGTPHELTAGAMITAVGGALMMQGLGYWQNVWRFWPLLLIGAGVMLIIEAMGYGGRRSGCCMGGRMGSWQDRHAWRQQRRAWRAQQRAGWAQWKAGWGQGPVPYPAPTSSFPSAATESGNDSGAASADLNGSGWLNMEAYFSENKRRVVAPGLQGGRVAAFFGACKLDLRTAPQPPGARLQLDANAVFGEVQIYIPSTWKVHVQGVGVFGNFQDETIPPVTPFSENDVQLLVRGTAAFGQVAVRN